MPMRFSTEAANADVMGEDLAPGTTPEGTPPAAGGAPRGPTARAHERGSKSRDAHEGEAKPGKDINAAGFIKDQDSGKS